jgi:mRNA interferase MazF
MSGTPRPLVTGRGPTPNRGEPVKPTPNWAELWWSELPEAGRRPVLILTRPEAVNRLPRILVAPATTNIRGLPSEVALDETDGLSRPCVLNLDTPELVPRQFLVERIGVLTAHRWHEVCAALERAVNCTA